MSRFNSLVREPLVHFLTIGVVLFVAFELRQEDSGETENLILISGGQVEQFSAQFQRTRLRPPTETELAGLIEGYVRDEVYYREARAMGLDLNDGIVRQRMRLKLEFLLEDLTTEAAPDDEQLVQFMQEHPERFLIEPQVAFIQVYLNPDKHQDVAADAKQTLTRLIGGASPETEGDGSLVEQEFTLSSQYKIRNSFGETFAKEIVTLDPGGWTGPIFSGYGAHLVRVSEKREGRFPELSEVRDEVERDYLAQRRQEMKDLTYGKLREGYEVVVETEAAGSLQGQSSE
jgi:hypothetical protein